MSTSQRILDNAQYHSDLLRTQEELQYAPSALAQQTKYLEDLKNELQNVKKNVAKLTEITKKERKEHEVLRDSTARRLAHKLAGKKEKFEAKREKEEREYVEALEKEMRERGNQTMLENMVKDAIQVKADLTEKTQRLKLAKDEVVNLYGAIFDGYTPEFPRDDQLEQQMRTAQETYDRIQAQLNSNSQAVGLLQQADRMMDMALKNMDEALSYSTWDMYGRGTFADMMERNALSSAAMAAGKAEILIQQAQRSSSQVQSIGPLRVHDISLVGDVFFDNIFSDYQAHKKIEANREKLAKSHRRLKIELRAARQRSQTSGADLVEASEVLTECHQDLERYRREIFQRITSGSTGASDSETGDVLPSYEARSTTVLISAEGSAINPESVTPASAVTPTNVRGRTNAVGRVYSPPPGPPPGNVASSGQSSGSGISSSGSGSGSQSPPAVVTRVYQPPPGPPPGHTGSPTLSSSVSEPRPTTPARMYQPPSSAPPGHPTGSPTRGGQSPSRNYGSGSGDGRSSSPAHRGPPTTLDKDLPTLPLPSTPQQISSPGFYSHFRRASDSSVTVTVTSPSRQNSSSSSSQAIYQSASGESESGHEGRDVAGREESQNQNVSSDSLSHRRGLSVPVALKSSSSLSLDKALPGPPSHTMMGQDLNQSDTRSGDSATRDSSNLSDEDEHEHVPVHWGSRNPFAAMMMSGHRPQDAEGHSKAIASSH